MACFGPLLLPPRPPPLPNGNSSAGRRSPGSTRLQRRRSSSTCRPPLSSTYLSFRDDVDFEELAPRPAPPAPPPKPRALVLQRSHSEGNLKNLVATRTFNKCIRALSGSWKNLLQWHKDKPVVPTLILPPPPCGNLQRFAPLITSAVGGMSRAPNKQPAQVKKVAPPSVPDVFRHSGSSFGSAGYSSSEDFLPPPVDVSGRGKQNHNFIINPWCPMGTMRLSINNAITSFIVRHMSTWSLSPSYALINFYVDKRTMSTT
ncbi:hypothetical protein B566_EDAN016294 [Ephemera danica]|nr:hypothetical protein B566_EDAN016294 [Ephemera danica]